MTDEAKNGRYPLAVRERTQGNLQAYWQRATLNSFWNLLIWNYCRIFPQSKKKAVLKTDMDL
jgi:hypothetical protein